MLSLRALDKNRGVSCAAILTLALGLGANMAIFSIVDNLLLKPLPVEDPERLVLVTSGRRNAWGNVVWEEIRDRKLLERSFAFATARLDLAAAGEREPVESAWVSGSFFEGLGVLAVVGRTLGERDDRRGGGADGPVAVISHRFWQREYDGARDVVGRSVSVSRVAFTIVGVVQPDFHGPEVGKATDLYLPIAAARLLPGLDIMPGFADFVLAADHGSPRGRSIDRRRHCCAPPGPAADSGLGDAGAPVRARPRALHERAAHGRAGVGWCLRSTGDLR